MPHGPQIIEHEAAPQHEAPTDHNVAAEGRTRAGMARTAPMIAMGRTGERETEVEVKVVSAGGRVEGGSDRAKRVSGDVF